MTRPGNREEVKKQNREYVEAMCKMLGGSENGGGGFTIPVTEARAVFVFFAANRVFIAVRERGATIINYQQTEGIATRTWPTLFAAKFDKSFAACAQEIGT